MKKYKVLLWIIGGLMIAILLCSWIIVTLPEGKLQLWFMDVGQGDSILARLPGGEWILVDGGPDARVLEEMGKIIPFYEREIELVIMTHPHADHINGLLDVFNRYQVKNLLLTGVEYDYTGYRRLMEIVREKEIRLWYPEKGKDLRIGKTALDLIYPEKPLTGQGFGNINNSSLVFRLIHGDFIAFFSGDLEQDVEAQLVKKKGLQLSADILKAGHHGSKTSNSTIFLQKIGPTLAVISCGIDNKFGHPFAGTLERLRQAGARIRRTDLEGTIKITQGNYISTREILAPRFCNFPSIFS